MATAGADIALSKNAADGITGAVAMRPIMAIIITATTTAATADRTAVKCITAKRMVDLMAEKCMVDLMEAAHLTVAADLTVVVAQHTAVVEHMVVARHMAAVEHLTVAVEAHMVAEHLMAADTGNR